MMDNGYGKLCFGAALMASASTAWAAPVASPAVRLDPAAMRAVGKVDPGFQSYNVEMAEVVGGRFWAPYRTTSAPDGQRSGGVDMSAGMFRKRDPIDLRNPRLVNMAKALGLAYVRVSGGWANGAYFQDNDAPQPAKAPAGYQSVLTRGQWAGVVGFAKVANARLVISFGASDGARDTAGVWNPDQAERLIRYTKEIGGSIYAAEMINEPNVGTMVGLPKGYDAARFAQDVATFGQLLRKSAPTMKTVGPGSTGEAGFQLFPARAGSISTETLMTAEPRPAFDIFSYHFYGAVSQRCAAMGPNLDIAPDKALSEDWLARADTGFDYYKALRDRFMPGKPIWVTEAAQAACGGDAWAATYLDTFRYVDQMGRLAKRGASVIFHNTLAASDYALIDDVTFQPRPSYWAAVLWRRTMGETVLDSGPIQPGLHIYAQCLPDRRGGVGMVAINLDRDQSKSIDLAGPAKRYTLTADTLQSGSVRLNGKLLALSGDKLPALAPVAAAKGTLNLAPASITFLTFASANNVACR